ncbi:5'-nucleotidase C-terminal domain-containing protein [Orrella sp. JC864]
MAASLLAACSSSDDDDDDHRPSDPPEQPAPPTPIDLTLLHINDHHSNLDGRTLTLNLRNAAGDTVQARVPSAGFARVTTAFRELAQDKENVIKLHAGDALTGSLYFNRAGEIGEADAAMMNTVCFDAFTLGNHEFDKGDTELKNFIDRLHAGDCQTPVISANVHFGAASALHPSNAPGYVHPYTVIERSGQKIGIVGLTIAGKTQQSSSPDAGTTFEDEAAAAQRAIDALQEQGVNKIILSTHVGYELDKKLIAELRGVDAVVGGDSHSLLGPATMAQVGVGTPAGAYAEQLTNKDGEPVCLAQAWEYSQVVGEMKISFDADGVVTACEGTPHVLIGETFTPPAGGAFSEADIAALKADAAQYGFLRHTLEDAAAIATLAPFKAKVDAYSQQVVAVTAEELCSRRVPGGSGSVDYGRSSAACNALGEVSARGGDIQQLVAQAYLEVANADYGGADITLQSGGGVRVPLNGQVTAANVIEVLPFGNMLYRLDITGAEAKAMIEDGLEATFGPGGSTGPYPYTGGLRFAVDASQPRGSRASNLQVLDQTTGLWNPIDPGATYRLFVLSFNAEGGDGYTTLANVPAERRVDIGVLDADVFQTYIDRLPNRNSQDLPIIQKLDGQFYSTQSFVGP